MALVSQPMDAQEQVQVQDEEFRQNRVGSRFAHFARHYLRNRAGVFGLILLLGIILMAVFAPYVTPHVTPSTAFFFRYGQPRDPTFDQFPARIFGNTENVADVGNTDTALSLLNASVLSLVAVGARASLAIGLISALFSSLIGTFIGAISGYFGGWVEAIFMHLTDLALSLPILPLIILISFASIQSPTPQSLIIVFSLVGWAGTARLVYGNFLSLSQLGYVEAAQATGVGNWRIIFRHILPNSLAPLIVATVLSVAEFILAESTLDSLFLGITHVITWGNVIAIAKGYLLNGNWWWVFFPGLFIALTVIALTFIGEALRDAFDIRSQREG